MLHDYEWDIASIQLPLSFSQLLAFLQGLFTFYHEGYELAHEFEPYKQQLQFNLQNVRDFRWRGLTYRFKNEPTNTLCLYKSHCVVKLVIKLLIVWINPVLYITISSIYFCIWKELYFGYRQWCPCRTNTVVLMFSLKTRNNFESTRQEVENLMRRIRSAEQDFKAPGQWTMEGFLYVQEKREDHPEQCTFRILIFK